MRWVLERKESLLRDTARSRRHHRGRRSNRAWLTLQPVSSWKRESRPIAESSVPRARPLSILPCLALVLRPALT